MLQASDQAPAPTLPSLQAWLLTRAMPLWLDHGIDRRASAFREWLAPGEYSCDATFRRLRVVTRQIVVFSRAHIAGVPGAEEAVSLGVEFLARHAAQPNGGYAWKFDLANRPIDTTIDLYDHAFVLLALAEAAAILPTQPLRQKSLSVLAFIDNHLRHPVRGWLESIPARLPRRQNPHMHLLEAVLAAYRAFGDPVFMDRATSLVGLFLECLLDPSTGALPEWFDDNLRPQCEAAVFLTEPGHHCEWAWLLHEYGVHAGATPRRHEAAKRLLQFSEAHGAHPHTGDLIDLVTSTGQAHATSARLWPQTERLKVAFLYPAQSATARETAVSSAGGISEA